MMPLSVNQAVVKARHTAPQFGLKVKIEKNQGPFEDWAFATNLLGSTAASGFLTQAMGYPNFLVAHTVGLAKSIGLPTLAETLVAKPVIAALGIVGAGGILKLFSRAADGFFRLNNHTIKVDPSTSKTLTEIKGKLDKFFDSAPAASTITAQIKRVE